MRIAVGSDHAGFPLKAALAGWLQELGHEVLDLGAYSTDSVDYPLIGFEVASRVAQGEAERGVLVCGSGIGVSIAANRVAGARAALVQEPLSARLAREHNDANVVCVGARLIGEEMAREILKVFLGTPFEGGRHQRRIDQLDQRPLAVAPEER
ncbi:Ribose-5-phosphate isomerase B [compost metagenome]